MRHMTGVQTCGDGRWVGGQAKDTPLGERKILQASIIEPLVTAFAIGAFLVSRSLDRKSNIWKF